MNLQHKKALTAQQRQLLAALETHDLPLICSRRVRVRNAYGWTYWSEPLRPKIEQLHAPDDWNLIKGPDFVPATRTVRSLLRRGLVGLYRVGGTLSLRSRARTDITNAAETLRFSNDVGNTEYWLRRDSWMVGVPAAISRYFAAKTEHQWLLAITKLEAERAAKRKN